MAKKRRAFRHDKNRIQPANDFQAQRDTSPARKGRLATMLHPLDTPPPCKRGVAKARRKRIQNHVPPDHTTNSTLGDRFNNLPTELRAEIFSHLLVQPVKWDIEHEAECLLRTCNADITPEAPYCGEDGNGKPWLCASGGTWPTRVWPLGAAQGTFWTSPWRSEWAPEQRNPYVCSMCWDANLRPGVYPKPKSLPCLCARRRNLQVFLVSKKWYAEAGHVFYTQNTFAFDDCTTFVDFVTHLPPVWKSTISKVSIMMTITAMFEVVGGVTTLTADWRASNSKFSHMLSGLQTLPALAYLELDYPYVTDNAKWVHKMTRLNKPNLKQVRFVREAPWSDEWKKGAPTIWPGFAGRSLIQGDFAEDLARAIKGQRVSRRRLQKKGVIVAALKERHNEFIKNALEGK